jgi:predicted nucleotide-binding protein (sugar kinase/HSP70/actin superfamily)
LWVLGRLSSELDLPVLSLSIDEQTGKAGVETRLEALLDLARSRSRKRVAAGVPVVRVEGGWQVGNSS